MTSSSALALPPGPPLPRPVQGLLFARFRHQMIRRFRARYGNVFSVNMPIFGRTVVLCEPRLIKELFTTDTEIVGQVEPNLGRMFGPGSFFAIEGEEHRRQRKLLTPPFHGRRMKAYEDLMVEEVRREVEHWPEGRPIPTLESMNRITLNIILRAVFGADGHDQAELRRILPDLVLLGSRLSVLPFNREGGGVLNPWRRFARMRREYDVVVDRLIAAARSDARLDEREDILAMMLQSRYDDGSAMSDSDIADQLFTLLAAGHETTANTLAWALERIRRHPELLRRLQAEADTGEGTLRAATILEVQRTRPVVILTSRQVKAESYRLGSWTLPRGTVIAVAIDAVQQDDEIFPDAGRFDPDRFVGTRPDSYSWIPFGGGTRRCIGAAFATMEMDVVLRTLLTMFEFEPTTEPDERWASRGVTFAPAGHGTVVVRRRLAGVGGRQ
jgi:cytochrome P450